MEISQITDFFYIGDAGAARNETLIREHKFDLILNTAKDLHSPWFEGIESIKVGLMDYDTKENRFMYYVGAYILYECLQNKKKVLIHCYEGKSRSTIIVWITLSFLRWRGLFGVESLIDAIDAVYEYMTLKRPQCSQIQPHHRLYMEETILLLDKNIRYV